ncbi:MAG TPA: ABC transporter ATP-binding protein [Thermomicrobiales bacterium]|jgi:spermidine/putrescine transport system ATP-binding protein|nr:ABC transporter ATP-binding protein [Thermomicrobiales bacterium]
MTATATAHDVELRSITKRYGSVLALDALSLDVRTGEFMTLLGPSGGGKSTTLRMIGGFLSPDRGEILLRGRPIADVPAHDRETATVFQSYALFPHLSIGDNIGYGLQQQGVPKSAIRDRVREALALVALPGTENRRPHELSGGQQQRVALARALAVLPAVLLLDEPLGALDVSLRRQMQEELRAIQQRTGITFIYVTHDQEEALSMSDRLAVIRDGRVVQVGPPEQLYERPDDAFVARFMGAGNILTGPVLSAEGNRSTLRLGGQAVGLDGVRPGADGKGTVMVRPERLRVVSPESADPGADTVQWSATVNSLRYQGATTAVRLTASDGTELIASVRPDDLAGIAPGATVRVTTESRHLVPLAP